MVPLVETFRCISQLGMVAFLHHVLSSVVEVNDNLVDQYFIQPSIYPSGQLIVVSFTVEFYATKVLLSNSH